MHPIAGRWVDRRLVRRDDGRIKPRYHGAQCSGLSAGRDRAYVQGQAMRHGDIAALFQGARRVVVDLVRQTSAC